MPIRFELHAVPHPYKLCMICNDALGTNCVTIGPGMKTARTVFCCSEHLGDMLKDLGESIIRQIEEEKDNGPH